MSTTSNPYRLKMGQPRFEGEAERVVIPCGSACIFRESVLNLHYTEKAVKKRVPQGHSFCFCENVVTLGLEPRAPSLKGMCSTG